MNTAAVTIADERVTEYEQEEIDAGLVAAEELAEAAAAAWAEWRAVGVGSAEEAAVLAQDGWTPAAFRTAAGW